MHYIMKVYIDRNNIQVQLIRFRKKATLFPLESLKWNNFRDRVFMKLGSLLPVRCRHRSLKSRGPALEMRGVVVQARAFVYLIFQLTKYADRYIE